MVINAAKYPAVNSSPGGSFLKHCIASSRYTLALSIMIFVIFSARFSHSRGVVDPSARSTCLATGLDDRIFRGILVPHVAVGCYFTCHQSLLESRLHIHQKSKLSGRQCKPVQVRHKMPGKIPQWLMLNVDSSL